jgi:hypothetical protein
MPWHIASSAVTAKPKSHLRLVAVDGAQIAPTPRCRVRDAAHREEREITLLTIKEYLGNLTHSVSRILALVKELKECRGVSPPDFTPHPLSDLPRGTA